MFIINSQLTSHTDTDTQYSTQTHTTKRCTNTNTHCKYLVLEFDYIILTLKSASATDLNKVQRTFVAIDLSGP